MTNPNSLAFVEQDARQSFMQGNSAMIPVWWWAYSGFYQPRQLDADQGSGRLCRDALLPGHHVDLCDLDAVLDLVEYSQNQDAAWEFLKWLSNPDMDRANAIEREVGGETIINNVVTHISSLTDPDVNAANADIQAAAYDSLRNSDIMPQIPEWPEVGRHPVGRDRRGRRRRQCARADDGPRPRQSDRVLRRAGRIQ